MNSCLQPITNSKNRPWFYDIWVTMYVVRQFEGLCAENLLIILYSKISLIRKTTNERDYKISSVIAEKQLQ